MFTSIRRQIIRYDGMDYREKSGLRVRGSEEKDIIARLPRSSIKVVKYDR